MNDLLSMDLIKYCIRHMSSKGYVFSFYDSHGIFYKTSDSYEQLGERLQSSNGFNFSTEEL